jgi:hypothetical protein
MKYYHCPNCGISIPDMGDKILKHKTYCKSRCDYSSTGSINGNFAVETLSELLAMDLTKPPRKVKVSKKPQGEIKITLKPELDLPAQFLLVLLPAAIYVNPFDRPGMVVAPIAKTAFGLFTLIFVFNLIYTVFGKWELTLNNGRGTFFSGIGKIGRKQTFSYTKNSTINMAIPSHTRKENQHRPEYGFSRYPPSLLFFLQMNAMGIIVTTGGKKIAFGGAIPREDVIKYMAACLLREITK